MSLPNSQGHSIGFAPVARTALLSACALLTLACSPLTIVNLASPNWQQTRHRDLPYQAEGALTLDLYTPNRSQGKRPVIVFFYGGSWQRGSKDAYRFAASRLTRAGFVVVIPNYRLYPEVVFPRFVHDGASAVSWTMKNVAQYGGDPSAVFLMGHSAGAQIAALLHYDSRYLTTSAAPLAPAGFIGLSGPYDFLPLTSSALKAVFPEAVRAESQPINFSHGDAAPALLLHGAEDRTVGPKNSRRLAERVIAQGGQARTIFYPGRGHSGVLLALTRPFSGLAPVVEDLTAFVHARTATDTQDLPD